MWEYKLFKLYRPHNINLNIGIGPKDGNAKFYVFEDEDLSTFSEETVLLNKQLGHKIIDEREVEIMTMESLFDRYLKGVEVDFISIDTEGYDLEILKTNNWSTCRPHFVLAETAECSDKIFGKKLNSSYDPFMESVGYIKMADTYLNTIYMDKNFFN